MDAVIEGLRAAGFDPNGDASGCLLVPRAATIDELLRVHPVDHLERLAALSAAGGGRIDPDTVASRYSWDAAVHAAGAGLAAIEALRAGARHSAFLAVRPPGHHATPARSMGFCLINNVAVSAAALTAVGERVLIVDWDAHHGNGTQEIFYDDPDVLYVSLHEWPLYPGTGAIDEVGGPGALGTNLNVPLPAGATGDVYLDAFDRLIAPVAAGFGPDWVLVSAGFDSHRADPLAGLGLSSGDYVDLVGRVLDLAPGPDRTILFLEGGYDLRALRDSVLATTTALAGDPVRPEPATTGGPGDRAVDRARAIWGI